MKNQPVLQLTIRSLLKISFKTMSVLLLLSLYFGANAQTSFYTTVLSGANEAPPNASPGTGTVSITINSTLNTMRVQCSFSGLLGATTACHIHAATAAPLTGTAGVATTTPTFTGFPTGVTSGTYDNTFDMTLASSYNPAYVTANGGTTASAFAALKAAIAAGTSYFNVHSTVVPGGEIRGFLVAAAPTNRIYVDASAAAGGTGSSWAAAIQQLSTAVTMANANPAITSIWVADGTYKTTTGTDRTASLTISRSNLRIIGGFAGNESNETDANPTTNATIISGDIGTIGETSDNSYHLFDIHQIPAATNGITISGFTVSGGTAVGGYFNAGGALLAYYNPTNTPVRFARCNFLNNTTNYAGGAVYLEAADVLFDSCRFANNTAPVGGAIFTFKSSPQLNHTVFATNQATNSGGAYYGNYGHPIFTACVFRSNTANYGGAVYQNQCDVDYINNVLSGNNGYEGGAVYAHNAATVRVLNSTFHANAASYQAGAVFLGYNNATLLSANSIYWNNTKAGANNVSGADIVNFGGGSLAVGYNMLQANTAVPADNGLTIQANNRGINPMFTNDANPIGADGAWFTTDDGLQLQDGAAVNTGSNTALTAASLVVDILGNARTQCTTVDKGAYERTTCCSNPGSLLLGTTVTGTLMFNGGSANYFNSANGFVPAGCSNSSLGSATVTITDPNSEFCFLDGANNDVANFSNNTLTISDVSLNSAGSINFIMTFQLAPGIVGSVTEVSDNFPNGLNYTYNNNLLTVFTSAFSGAGNRSAVYSFSACPAVNLPAFVGKSIASDDVAKAKDIPNSMGSLFVPSLGTQPKETTSAIGVSAAVSPNPHHGLVKFSLRSDIPGKGVLEVYNNLGQKVQTVFNGQVTAGHEQTVNYVVPPANGTFLIYKFKVNDKQAVGKLMYIK